MAVSLAAVLTAAFALSLDPARSPGSALAAPAQASASKATPAAVGTDLDLSRSEVRALIERFTADAGSLSRSYPIVASASRHARLRRFYKDWMGRLEKVGFSGLAQDGQIDYLLFQNYLNRELFRLDLQDKSLAETATLLPFAETIIALEEDRRWMRPVDSPKAAATLARLKKLVDETRKKVEAGLKAEAKTEAQPAISRPKKTVANRAAINTGRLRETLKNWFGFYNGYDPIFTWWVGEPYKTADKSLQEYADFLLEKVVGVKPGDNTAIVGDPIGREALISELRFEMIPYTPEELVAIGNSEFAWCEAEMKKASRQLGYGDDWHKALEQVKTMYVEPGKQPALIRDLANEAIEFLDKNDLVTVPELARESWRMGMMSLERQLVNPFFTGGEMISVSYPTNTMTHEQKMMSMRGNNIPFSRATVHHELIPGHHLQGFMSARYRPYRGLFHTAFFGEGWALYWEMLLWDLNFPKSPEDRIGFLFWRMHRCARIIFSLSFHLEKMMPQEAIDFLVERVGHERDNAAAEVRRSFGAAGPLYQAAYMLGGLQIRALHRELVGPGKMSNRQFHDSALKEGGISVELLRASLTGRKLSHDFSSNWKFYGPNPLSGSGN